MELDLSLFKGRVPVELMGRSKFPPIGDLPYLLTLGTYGFYAFRLATDVEAPAWHEEHPVSPDLPVLVLVEKGWHTLFGKPDGGEGMNQLMVRRAKDQLERQIIPHFFRSQLWFVDADATVEKFEFGEMREWSVDHSSWLLTTVAVYLGEGEPHRYAIPLALAWEDEGEERVNSLLHATLAKVRRSARVGILFDAFWDDAFCCAVLAGMEQGISLDFGKGRLQFKATTAFQGIKCPVGTSTVIRTMSERGRLLVNLDDQYMLKNYRWLLAGEHPELELSRFLTEVAKFPHIPQLAGTIEYSDPEGNRATLVILEHYAENQGKGWNFTLDYLERFLDECRSSPEHTPDKRHIAYVGLMKKLGQRTAEFHQALSQQDSSGVFGSDPMTADDMGEWVRSVRMKMDSVLELLELEIPRLPDGAQQAGNKVLNLRPRLYRRIMRAAELRSGVIKIRCHGDYHLGQVWLKSNDFLITNYGGEPSQTWSERRKKNTPLSDVAGMLLSFMEVGTAALDHVAGDSAEMAAGLQQHLEIWQTVASQTFFKSYRKTMREYGLYPLDAEDAEALITLFMADKVLTKLDDALTQHSTAVGANLRWLTQVALRRR